MDGEHAIAKKCTLGCFTTALFDSSTHAHYCMLSLAVPIAVARSVLGSNNCMQHNKVCRTSTNSQGRFLWQVAERCQVGPGCLFTGFCTGKPLLAHNIYHHWSQWQILRKPDMLQRHLD